MCALCLRHLCGPQQQAGNRVDGEIANVVNFFRNASQKVVHNLPLYIAVDTPGQLTLASLSKLARVVPDVLWPGWQVQGWGKAVARDPLVKGDRRKRPDTAAPPASRLLPWLPNALATSD